MKLSTGKVAFPIEFDNGDKDCIYFNPSDPDLMIRIKNVESRIEEKIGEIKDVELTADGNPIGDFVEEFERIQTIIKNEIDVVFDSNISEIVFKHCSPFAIVNGDYFMLAFLDAIKPEIEKHIKKSRAEAAKRMNKHIGKYKK